MSYTVIRKENSNIVQILNNSTNDKLVVSREEWDTTFSSSAQNTARKIEKRYL